MKKAITAVVVGGLLRPDERLPFREGERVRLELDLPVPTTDLAELDRALDAIEQEANRHSKEYWDEFQDFLRANRITFPART